MYIPSRQRACVQKPFSFDSAFCRSLISPPSLSSRFLSRTLPPSLPPSFRSTLPPYLPTYLPTYLPLFFSLPLLSSHPFPFCLEL